MSLTTQIRNYFTQESIAPHKRTTTAHRLLSETLQALDSLNGEVSQLKCLNDSLYKDLDDANEELDQLRPQPETILEYLARTHQCGSLATTSQGVLSPTKPGLKTPPPER